MTVKIRSVPASAILELRPALVEVYRKAFTGPPYHEGEGTARQFARALEEHVRRPGLKFVIALIGDEAVDAAIEERPAEDVAGFAYGYTSRPGQWWYDAVSDRLDPAVNAAWMDDPFEVVELAVRPPLQGQGIGGRLHDALLRRLPHRTAVLSTAAAETTAMHLYRKRGWVILSETFTFPGSDVPYVIMGLRLEDSG